MAETESVAEYHAVRLAPVKIGKQTAHKGVWRMRVMPRRNARLGRTMQAIRRVTKSAYGLPEVTVPASHGIPYEVAWPYELPHQEQRARSAFETITRYLVKHKLIEKFDESAVVEAPSEEA